MTEERLGGFIIHARVVQRGRVTMSDLMRCDRDAALGLVGGVQSCDAMVHQRAFAAIVRKNVPMLFIGQGRGQRRQKRNDAVTCLCLRVFDIRTRANVVGGLVNSDLFRLAVDILIAQRKRFPSAAAGVIDQIRKEPERFVEALFD